MILPALADVHIAVPVRAGGGGKRARLGAAPVLESIMEGVPALAEEDDGSSSQLPPPQPQLTPANASLPALPQAAVAARAVVGPDGAAETWLVEAQQAAAQ